MATIRVLQDSVSLPVTSLARVRVVRDVIGLLQTTSTVRVYSDRYSLPVIANIRLYRRINGQVVEVIAEGA